MLLRIISAGILCLGAWYLGMEYSFIIKHRIRVVKDYITLTAGLKSAVKYSGKNIYAYLKTVNTGAAKNFCSFACENREKGLAYIFEQYESINLVESNCIDMLKENFLFAENSSDVEGIALFLAETCETLEAYRKSLEEEYRGKIKTAPSIALILGLFAAVLVI